MAEKVSHTATGTHTPDTLARKWLYAADYTTGSGVGTAQLQVQFGGDWLSVVSVTADKVPTLLEWSVQGENAVPTRWEITAFTSGTIATYLKPLTGEATA